MPTDEALSLCDLPYPDAPAVEESGDATAILDTPPPVAACCSLPVPLSQWAAECSLQGLDHLAGSYDHLASVVAALDAQVDALLTQMEAELRACTDCCHGHAGRLLDQGDAHLVRVLTRLDQHVADLLGEADAHLGSVVGALIQAEAPAPILSPVDGPASAPAGSDAPAGVTSPLVPETATERALADALAVYRQLPLVLPEQLGPLIALVVQQCMALCGIGRATAPPQTPSVLGAIGTALQSAVHLDLSRAPPWTIETIGDDVPDYSGLEG